MAPTAAADSCEYTAWNDVGRQRNTSRQSVLHKENGPATTGKCLWELMRSEWMAAVRGPYATAEQERPKSLG
jgi:hypothetical protein